MKYPKEYLEEIKIRLRVSQVVGKHVQLKKRGKEFIGLSPFKNEKTPSFTVNDEKGFYHCFSTGEHGNIFDFLMKTKSYGFGEAVKSLASEAGLPEYKFSKFDKEKDDRYEKYKKILKKYSEFSHEQLFDKKNSHALKYLKERKISEDVIKKFNLGFIPKYNDFFKHLSKSFSEDEIKMSGLYYIVEKNKKFIDRFNDRIIFPVKNLSGDTVAFGGRIINNKNLAKYINSPETEFYKKGSHLFNLNNAKDHRTLNEIIIVEGYIDVISLYMHDIKNVISNSGTALTENQINLIWKFFSDPIICLDGDQSGQLAAKRIAERLFPLINENNKIYFSILEEGKDPDDIIKSKGKEEFLKLLNKKKIIQTYLWEIYLKKIDINNPYDVAKFEKEIRKLCSTIKDSTLRKYILEDFLSKINNLTPNINFKFRSKDQKKLNRKILNETKKIHLQKKDLTRQNLIEYSILFIMIYYSGAIQKFIEKISTLKFSNEENENLKLNIISLLTQNKSEKDIEIETTKNNSTLIKKIYKNTNLKLIINKKNYDQITEVLKDLLEDLEEFDHLKRIESLEKKLINNMEEKAYSELIKLKSQINRG